MNKVSEEVYVPENEKIVTIDKEDIMTIQASAGKSSKHRSRMCLHNSPEDSIQEMIIVHNKSVYVRPHKHANGGESFHIIKGDLDVVLFDDNGNVIDIISLGAYHNGYEPLAFCYRLNEPVYHTLIVNSRFVAIHEVVNGPFRKENSTFPPWAPAEEETDAVRKWKAELEKKVCDFKILKNSTLKME